MAQTNQQTMRHLLGRISNGFFRTIPQAIWMLFVPEPLSVAPRRLAERTIDFFHAEQNAKTSLIRWRVSTCRTLLSGIWL